jgi:hypothetical protein
MGRLPTTVLVHGAWADGSSWTKVIPFLLAKDLFIIAVQNPLTSVEDDAFRLSGPVPAFLGDHLCACRLSRRRTLARSRNLSTRI